MSLPDRVSALLIASYEICYNPRLLKIADSLLARDVDVSVFSPVLGIAARDLYDQCVASRSWEVRSLDFSKGSWRSWSRWAATAVISRIALEAWRRGVWRGGFHLGANRALVAFDWAARPFDLVVVNLVDNLPMAARISRRHGSVLMYDSQEWFRGDASSLRAPGRAAWVVEAERRHVTEADVVTTTTNALADRLMETFALRHRPCRLRNAPLQATATRPAGGDARPAEGPLRVVWHGLAVHLKGRGVDVLLEALARCRRPVSLTLQGRIDDQQRHLIDARCAELGVADRVRFAPPAHPERVPASLAGHDVGVIAEPGLDENQRLTSSNKLFDYIHAGLAVVAPDLPGLAETVAGDDLGVLYPAGNASALAETIDRLASNIDFRLALQRRAVVAAPCLTWSRDFEPVWTGLQHALERGRRGRMPGDQREARP